MKRILRCDWLPERNLTLSGLLAVSRKKKRVLVPYNKSFIDQGCSRRLDIGLGLCFACLWTSTPTSTLDLTLGQDGWILASFFCFACLLDSNPSRSINTQKKNNLAIWTSHLVNNGRFHTRDG